MRVHVSAAGMRVSERVCVCTSDTSLMHHEPTSAHVGERVVGLSVVGVAVVGVSVLGAAVLNTRTIHSD